MILNKFTQKSIERLPFFVLIALAGFAFYEWLTSYDSLAFASSDDNVLFVSTGSGSDFLTYDDIISGFSVKYPSSWQLEQHLDKSVTFIAPRESNSDPFPAGLGITSKKVPSNLSITAITQKQLNTLKNLYPDIHILESVDTTFLGHQAHKLTFTATDNTQTLRKAMQIWFKTDTRTYLITYKASDEKFSSFLPIVERMLNSFYTYSTS
jgi:PsbP-like protein